MRTVETCIYPVLRDGNQVQVLLKHARIGPNRGKWVPIGHEVREDQAARDSALEDCAKLRMDGDSLTLCGLVTETCSAGWTIDLLLFRIELRARISVQADETAAEYRWFSLSDLSKLSMPQSDAKFSYEAMLSADGFFEARMRFDDNGRLHHVLVP